MTDAAELLALFRRFRQDRPRASLLVNRLMDLFHDPDFADAVLEYGVTRGDPEASAVLLDLVLAWLDKHTGEVLAAKDDDDDVENLDPFPVHLVSGISV